MITPYGYKNTPIASHIYDDRGTNRKEGTLCMGDQAMREEVF
jgi:hypothetical protein